jgi:Xaa-Pro aminopeptidase
MRTPDVLVVADSIRSAEIRHEVPLAIPDPFLYLEHDGRRVAVVGSFEVQRVEELGTGLEVFAYEHFGLDELMKQGLKPWEVSREIWLRACREAGVTSCVVPHSFPLEVADHLSANGVELRVDRELFNARRRTKNAFELAGIRRAQRACEAGMDADMRARTRRGRGRLHRSRSRGRRVDRLARAADRCRS